jgi:hypothetical protein
MKNILRFSIVIITIALFAIPSVFSQEIKADKSAEYEDPYSSIQNLTLIKLKEKALTIKVFETGGGDPAMNGNKLVLNICEWDYADGNCYTWETGINIYEVKSIKTQGNKCIIKCTEHQLKDDKGLIQTVPAQYIISYYFDENNHLKNMINIEK